MTTGNDALNTGKARLSQVFDYLSALDQLRNPAKRLVEEQPWHCWLHDIPAYPSIRRGVTQEHDSEEVVDDYILRVRRPSVTPGPQIPGVLEDWIVVADRSDPDSAVEVLATRNAVDQSGASVVLRFEDDPDRVVASTIWRQAWNEWAENERPARRALALFERLYALYGQMEREGERLELVLGDGILHWRRPEGRIHHPLLLQRLALEFAPAVPEFIIRETDHPMEFYAAVFRGVNDVEGKALAQSQAELDAGRFHPLGGAATSGFLRSVVARLSARGQYLDDWQQSASAVDPEIYRAPVLFLRARTLGFANALDAIRDDLRRRTDLPVALLNIMGVEALPELSEDRQTHLGSANEEQDVLLSKPANPEQVQIARRLARYGAVLVQGPPGTGKTYTIGNLIGHLLAQGKSVLVTSHTSKALQVLHGQITPQLRPLCVSVLGNDTGNRDALERAVAGIAERLSSSAEELEEQATRLELERNGLLQRVRAAREALLNCVGGEYRDILLAGEAYSPSSAARLVAEGDPSDAWIPGPLQPGAPLPLAPVDLTDLYRTNIALTEQEEREIDADLPSPESLLAPDLFAKLVREEAALRRQDRATGARYWTQPIPSPTVAGLANLQQEAATALELLHGEEWKLALIQAGHLGGGHRRVWDDFLQVMTDWAELGVQCEQRIAEFGPQLAEGGDDTQHLQTIDEMLAHLASGGDLGKWTLLVHRGWRHVLNEALVDGARPKRREHLEALRALVQLRISRAQLRARWDRLMQPVGGPSAADLGERPEQSALRLKPVMIGCLQWQGSTWEPFEAELGRSGFNWPGLLDETPPDLGTYGDLVRLRRAVEARLLPALAARKAATELHLVEAELDARCTAVQAAAAQGGSGLLLQLGDAMARRDADAYAACYGRLVDLHARSDLLRRRRALLSTIDPVAPEWAAAVRTRSGIHGRSQPPGDAAAAWRWRQLAQELDRRAALSPEHLQRQIEDLRQELERTTAELVDRRAWSAQIRRVSLRERLALVGWLQIVRRIGRGTGKRVPQLVAEARRLMAECRSAVPVWIMPLARVVENFDPRVTRFDVVVIDEASQSDVMALIALYLGKQVLVVGDDEQVSPDAVGQNLTAVGQLMEQYLRDVPNGQLYDGQMSIYDLAKASFGGTIRLTEHFRCVPEIIQFSNDLSYDGALKPLRDGTTVLRKPPLVAYRTNGYSTASNINREEAVTVAALIAAATEQPEYAEASFGVISLVGEQQALEIDRLLRAHLSPVELERRRIVCGNAAHFQGDERDVMFLSVVDGPTGNPLPTRAQPLFKKRFNVAASRARDQMWVVYSVDPAVDFRPGDLRKRLIEHALDPAALMRKLDPIEQRVESEFERQVARRLVDAGFDVTPQWQVGYYRIDLVVRGSGRQLAVECDGDRYHPLEKLPQDMERQAILERLGWRFVRVRGSEYFRDPDEAMRPVFERLNALGIEPNGSLVLAAGIEVDSLQGRVIRRAAEIRREWEGLPPGPREITLQEPDRGRGTTPVGTATDGENNGSPPVDGHQGESHSLSSGRSSDAVEGSSSTSASRPVAPGYDRDDARVQKSGQLFLPDDVASTAALPPPMSQSYDLRELFRSCGLQWRDNRGDGGALWVIGGLELRGLMDDLRSKGFNFRFTPRGSRATRHRPAWFLPGE